MTEHRPQVNAYPWLLPERIRGWEFPRTRWGRCGLDPVAVAAFLERLADEVAAVHAELAVWAAFAAQPAPVQRRAESGPGGVRSDRQGVNRVVGRARPHPNERPVGRHRR